MAKVLLVISWSFTVGTSPSTSPVMLHYSSVSNSIRDVVDVKALYKECALESTKKGKQKAEVSKQTSSTMLVCEVVAIQEGVLTWRGR